jgi:hypothetical protein
MKELIISIVFCVLLNSHLVISIRSIYSHPYSIRWTSKNFFKNPTINMIAKEKEIRSRQMEKERAEKIHRMLSNYGRASSSFLRDFWTTRY